MDEHARPIEVDGTRGLRVRESADDLHEARGLRDPLATPGRTAAISGLVRAALRLGVSALDDAPGGREHRDDLGRIVFGKVDDDAGPTGAGRADENVVLRQAPRKLT
ncbi:Uncharacterised protein [Mycobacteroides abscessus subsp. abscessus]|nr:Uncharacterised protein [Mycobacteroides abscessus subsp. abscessus]